MSEINTTTEYLKNVTDSIRNIIDEAKQGKYIYRGVNKRHTCTRTSNFNGDNGEKRINSSLYRQCFSSTELLLPLNDIQQKNIKRARKRLSLSSQSDDEILTDFRHFGSKTNLIDFSWNLYVALFFACNDNYKEKGELILYCLSSLEDNNPSNSAKIKTIVPSLTKHSEKRILSQSSIFLESSEGFIPIDEEKCKVMDIESELKRPFLEYLQKYHDISHYTIYNDIFGFIEGERNQHLYIKESIRGTNLFNVGKFNEAIIYYNKAIELNPQEAETYYDRGNAKAELKDYTGALQDYSKAIELDPQDAGAYCNRGIVKAELKDYSKAIELDPLELIAKEPYKTTAKPLNSTLKMLELISTEEL